MQVCKAYQIFNTPQATLFGGDVVVLPLYQEVIIKLRYFFDISELKIIKPLSLAGEGLSAGYFLFNKLLFSF